MPNLPAHIHLAHQAGARLNHPAVNEHQGSFLLGSTTPDIRAMAKWPRERTHFVPLTVDRVGAGAQAMFEAHPALRDSQAANGPTRAFVAGYINHLVADESWIINIYRNFFESHDGQQNRLRGNMWDRAMQLDMDREARADLDDMKGVSQLLEGAEEGVEVGFIDSETLAEWRRWVQEFNTWEFSWDRLARAMRRMYGEDQEAGAMAQQFLESMPQSLQQVYELVTPERLASYREATVNSSVDLIREYLDAPAGN